MQDKDSYLNSWWFPGLVLAVLAGLIFLLGSRDVSAQEFRYPLLEASNPTFVSGTTWNINFVTVPCSGGWEWSQYYWDGSAWVGTGNGSSSGCEGASNDEMPFDPFGYNFDEGDAVYALNICDGGSGSCSTSSFDDPNWEFFAFFEKSGSTITVGLGQPDGATRINELNTPNAAETTASTTVDFSVTYTSATPQPDRICIDVNDMTAFQQLSSLCETITQSGVFEFATSSVYTEGHLHQWRAVIYDSSNAILDSSGWRTFNVVSAQQTTFTPGTSGWVFGELPSGTSSTSTLQELTLQCDPTDSLFSRSVCNLAVLLFVPDSTTIQNLDASLAGLFEKQPFSAFAEFRQGWLDATQNPDVPYSSLTLNFYNEPVQIISTTTFTAIVGDSWESLRLLIAIGLWVAFAWWMFVKVTRFF